MSFDPLKIARRNIGVRLGLWYASVFAVSSIVLLMVAYYLVVADIGRKDREVLETHLQSYAAIYENGGLPALRDAIQQESGNPKAFFIRLVNRWNEAAFVNIPTDWVAFKDIPSGLAGYRQRVGFIRIPKDAEKDFLIASMALPDNSLLQVGRSTDSRESLLEPLRRDFILFGSATILLGFLVGAFFAHRAMQPIRHVVATARSIIQTGRLDARVPMRKSNDELDEMVRSLQRSAREKRVTDPRHAGVPRQCGARPAHAVDPPAWHGGAGASTPGRAGRRARGAG